MCPVVRAARRVRVDVEDVEVNAAVAVPCPRPRLLPTPHAEKLAREPERSDRESWYFDWSEPCSKDQIRPLHRLDREVERIDQLPVLRWRSWFAVFELWLEVEAEIRLVQALPVTHPG